MKPDRRLSPEVVRGYSRLCLPQSKQCLSAVEIDEEIYVESRLTSSVLSGVKSEASKPPINVENETRRQYRFVILRIESTRAGYRYVLPTVDM
jgi:hypothetical protein